MKKQLIITLMDGRTITPDFDKVIGMGLGQMGANGTLIGAPADHPMYIRLCQTIAQSGFVDDHSSDIDMNFIAPAFIKTVSIKIEKPDLAASKLIITE